MAVPIDVATGPGDPGPDVPSAVPGQAIEGRSPGQIAWMRLRRDKVAMGGGIVVALLILTAIIGPQLYTNLLAWSVGYGAAYHLQGLPILTAALLIGLGLILALNVAKPKLVQPSLANA